MTDTSMVLPLPIPQKGGEPKALCILEIGDAGVAIWQDMGNAIARWPAFSWVAAGRAAILHPTIFWLVNGPRTSDEHGAKSTKKPKPPCRSSNKPIVKLLR